MAIETPAQTYRPATAEEMAQAKTTLSERLSDQNNPTLVIIRGVVSPSPKMAQMPVQPQAPEASTLTNADRGISPVDVSELKPTSEVDAACCHVIAKAVGVKITSRAADHVRQARAEIPRHKHGATVTASFHHQTRVKVANASHHGRHYTQVAEAHRHHKPTRFAKLKTRLVALYSPPKPASNPVQVAEQPKSRDPARGFLMALARIAGVAPSSVA